MIREELTLDPDDWEEFRRLARRMLDEMLDHLATLRSRPAWQPMPPDVRAAFEESLPIEGQGAEAAYHLFREKVLPYLNGNLHPRFFGWAMGNGTPLGMMADMLAAGANPHPAGFNQAPTLVEAQVIRWLKELIGFPSTSSGLLVLGGTMANILGLTVARYARAGFDVRESGLYGGAGRLMVYASTETHRWIKKAIEFLGMGRKSLRFVPTGCDFRMDLGALSGMIQEDRRSGHKPICVVGNAGTVNTGATDDLQGLAHLCSEEALWFHVDGAYGALIRLSERLRPIVAGIEQADSVGFDLHKWMYQPFDVACVLVRDADLHRAAFADSSNYLSPMSRGVMSGGLPYADLGIDLTRSFRALKVWMSLKAHGVTRFARLIEQNVEQARELATRVAEHPDLELLAPVPLNVVCFRFAPRGIGVEHLNRINEEILPQLQESGTAVPSSTVIDGCFAIRCAILNHRSRREDFAALIDGVVRIGWDLSAPMHQCGAS